MSYRRSRARLEFETQVNLAVKELTLLYKATQVHGAGSRLLAAYYVFAYSQLEVYVASLVEDTLVALKNSAPTLDKIPDLMLGYLVHRCENLASDYKRFSVDGDERALLRKVATTTRKVVSWSNSTGWFLAETEDFLDKKKYPSPKNMPQLFRRLGVENIWAVLGRSGRINAELVLTSLNDLRTGIAHEGKVPPGFGLVDFRDRIDQMRRFVVALDRSIANHFCAKAIRRTEWNGAMT
jgi:hypothetical protein